MHRVFDIAFLGLADEGRGVMGILLMNAFHSSSRGRKRGDYLIGMEVVRFYL